MTRKSGCPIFTASFAPKVGIVRSATAFAIITLMLAEADIRTALRDCYDPNLPLQHRRPRPASKAIAIAPDPDAPGARHPRRPRSLHIVHIQLIPTSPRATTPKPTSAPRSSNRLAGLEPVSPNHRASSFAAPAPLDPAPAYLRRRPPYPRPRRQPHPRSRSAERVAHAEGLKRYWVERVSFISNGVETCSFARSCNILSGALPDLNAPPPRKTPARPTSPTRRPGPHPSLRPGQRHRHQRPHPRRSTSSPASPADRLRHRLLRRRPLHPPRPHRPLAPARSAPAAPIQRRTPSSTSAPARAAP